MIFNHNKIAIVGYADTGKTRCSELFMDREVFHTDDCLDNLSDLLHQLTHNHSKWIVEGTEGVRFLRAGLEADLVIRLEPKFPCKAKHRAQRKGIDTVWNQWLAQKPECRIMILNEDVLEFMVEWEQQWARPFAVLNSTSERQIHKSWLTGDISKSEFKISRGSIGE